MRKNNNPDFDRMPPVFRKDEGRDRVADRYDRYEEPERDDGILDREVRLRRARVRKVNTVLDCIFGFMIVTVLAVAVGGLGLVYILTKGPSPDLSKDFVMTMSETRRFDFMSNLFLSAEEVAELQSSGETDLSEIEFDSSLITISSADATETETQEESPYAQDDDGDGLIFEEIKGPGFQGYMITILDPKRVFVGMPDTFGGIGLTLEQMVEKYDAIGGINGGGFKDEGGSGTGGLPEGLTIVDGVIHGDTNGESAFCGFNEEGIMHVGYYTAWLAEQMEIVSGVSFGPILIMNGQAMDPKSFEGGINPRTAIGQRADGAIMMMVIDGRQAHSMGATYEDCMEIMLSRGAVNAINMDGGSSTSMYYEGEYVNRNSAQYGVRNLPSAFLFK